MSWIRTEDGSLVNLEYTEVIDVMPLDVDEKEVCNHGLFIRQGEPDAEGEPREFCIFSGTEKQCKETMDKLVTKLPLVRL